MSCMKNLVEKNIEVNEKGENKKNVKESSYTNIDEHKEKEQAKLLKDEKTKYYHKIPRKKDENEKALVTKEMPYLIWARTFL